VTYNQTNEIIMKNIGLLLIAAGVVAMLYTGFKFTTQESVVDLGPLKIEREKKHSYNWPPVVGVLLLLSGVVVMIVDKKK
jgi:uncharacterized membrane protein SirB2